MKRYPMYPIVVCSGLAIIITLFYTLRVQAQQASSTRQQEEQAWRSVGATLTSMHVLRPAWLPAAFRHLPEVGSDSWSAGSVGGYGVDYCSADCFSGNATRIDFLLNPEKEPRGLDLRFPVRVRGNAGTFSIYRSGPTYEVSWHEAGQHYAVLGNRVWPSELLKIAAGLRRIF